MKKRLVKELHKMIMLIVKAGDKDLEGVAIKLLDIEKEIMKYNKETVDTLIDKI